MVDINGDGRTDIVSGQENFDLYNPPRTGEVDWWENTTPASGGGSGQAPRQLTGPVVTGTAKVGAVLRAKPPTWSVTPTKLVYQWQLCTARSCTPIKGATKSTLKLTPAEAGNSVRFVTTQTIAGKTITIASKKLVIRR